MDNVIAYIAGFFFLTTVGSIHLLDKKTVRVVTLESQISTIEQNNKILLDSISTQNELIEKYKVDLNASEERWKNREPVVVYIDKWKTKYVTKEVNASCDDILEAIRKNGF